MKISKELGDIIERELEEFEKARKEGKVKYYDEEEAFKIMFGGRYAGLSFQDFANGRIPEKVRRDF